MRNPNEALVFLARHEYSADAHERLMFVAVLYAAGASHVVIDTGESTRPPSKGVRIHLPASHAATRVLEQVLAEAISKRVIAGNIKQRGNVVHAEWT